MAPSVACSFFFDDELLGEPGTSRCTSTPSARDSDVFMYRGDTPYGTEECRHEQMHLDAVCAKQAARRQQRFSKETESLLGQRQSMKVSVAS